jgi:hypothetical protein
MDKKIYHEKNGEVITYDADEFYVFSKSKMEELISYKTEESNYGYFRVTLYYDSEEKKHIECGYGFRFRHIRGVNT